MGSRIKRADFLEEKKDKKLQEQSAKEMKDMKKIMTKKSRCYDKCNPRYLQIELRTNILYQ